MQILNIYCFGFFRDSDNNGVIQSKGEIEQWLKNMTKRGEVSGCGQ